MRTIIILTLLIAFIIAGCSGGSDNPVFPPDGKCTKFTNGMFMSETIKNLVYVHIDDWQYVDKLKCNQCHNIKYFEAGDQTP